jgi:hypothetical protein
MSDQVAVLTELTRVTEYTYAEAGVVDDRWLVAVALHFAEGTLVIEVDPNSDEVTMRLVEVVALDHWSDAAIARDATQQPAWASHIDAHCLWRWTLTNQQGYTDGAQIELELGQSTITVQWVAGASRLQVARVRAA